MGRPFVKITEIDLQMAEEFFENEKHFNEFILAVIYYYRGKNFKFSTKKVEKFFKTYKKTMDYIIAAAEFGKKKNLQSTDKETVITPTLQGSLQASLGNSLRVNNKEEIINNKEEIIKGEILVFFPSFFVFFSFVKTLKSYSPELDIAIKSKYDTWVAANWIDGYGKEIKNWKASITASMQYLKRSDLSDDKIKAKVNIKRGRIVS